MLLVVGNFEVVSRVIQWNVMPLIWKEGIFSLQHFIALAKVSDMYTLVDSK